MSLHMEILLCRFLYGSGGLGLEFQMIFRIPERLGEVGRYRVWIRHQGGHYFIAASYVLGLRCVGCDFKFVKPQVAVGFLMSLLVWNRFPTFGCKGWI